MTHLLVRDGLDGLQWQKSLRSAVNGACVEVALWGIMVAVRDSKQPQGPALTYTRDEWAAFLDGVKKGEFDHFSSAVGDLL